MIAREELVEALAASAAETTAVTWTEAERIAMGREEPPPGGIATVRGELMVRGSSGVPRG